LENQMMREASVVQQSCEFIHQWPNQRTLACLCYLRLRRKSSSTNIFLLASQ